MKIKEKPVQKTFKMTQAKKMKTKIGKKSKFKISKPKKKVDISKMSVEQFMSGGFNDVDDDEGDMSAGDAIQKVRGSKLQMNGKVKKLTGKVSLGIGKKVGIAKKLKNVEEEQKGLKRKLKEKKLKKKNPKKEELGDSDVEEEEEDEEVEDEDEDEDDEGQSDGDEGEEEEGDEDEDEEEDEDDEDEFDDGDEDIFKKHKKELDGLKTTDPEFYKYLQENDEDLLNFNESDSDEEEEEVEKCHKAPESLEVASDESDFEPEEGGLPLKKSDRSITMAMISNWQERLRTTKNRKLLRDVFDAFHAAVLRVSTGDDQLFRFKVEGSSVFNAIIRTCVMDLHPGLRSFLKLEEDSQCPPTQSKTWARIKPLLKSYFEDLTELARVTSSSMLTVLLKHIHQMIPFLIYFPNVAQRTLRRLIDLWSKCEEEVVRVLSFLCLLRLTNRSMTFLSTTLKKMYLTYVKNTKFVSPNTLPEINFMRKSLSEMCALDDTMSYQMAFVYIRQLAVHLRNAITLKKKENFQAVYNWQFVSSLHLWAELFTIVSVSSPLRSLVYPLIQIIIGTIKLIPSAQYYPLRFHCCKILINISNKCGVFIPVMPFLLEVLQCFDFNKEHKKLSMKPMDLTCVLRCSKLQMKENGFKDALIENVNNLMIEYIAVESHRISFPDVFVPAVLQLKQFVKDSKVVNYTKIIRALLEKINENSRFIENQRKALNFKLNDTKAVEAIEVGIKAKGTPFLTYYENWRKVYAQKQARKVVDNVKLGDYKLPVINKVDKKRAREESKSTSSSTVLFPSSDDESSDVSLGLGSESSSDEEDEKKEKKCKNAERPPAAKRKKGEKKVKKARKEDDAEEEETEGGQDIVRDFVLSDDE